MLEKMSSSLSVGLGLFSFPFFGRFWRVDMRMAPYTVGGASCPARRIIVDSKNKWTLSLPMFGRRCFQLRRYRVSNYSEQYK